MRAQGFDISKWQREWKESQSQVGHDFGWIKASEGLTTDPRFEQHYEPLLDVPVRGAFHYLTSDKPWEAQLDKFLNLLDGKSFHMAMMDFEGIGNDFNWQFGRNAQRFINHLVAEFEGRSLLYTNTKFYQEAYNMGHRWMDNFDLVYARYPYNGWDPSLENIQDPEDWVPTLPVGRTVWNFWQFSADGNRQGPKHGLTRQPWHIVPPAIDLQVFNGTREELEVYVGIGQDEPDPTPEPPSDDCDELRAAAEGVIIAAGEMEQVLNQ